MMLSNTENTIAIAGRKEVEKILEELKVKIGDLCKVDGWAIEGLPGEDNISHYWPIVKGNILHWTYDRRFMLTALKIVETFGRSCEVFAYPEQNSPIFIKIDMMPEKYLLIAPRDQRFGGD